MFGVQKVDFRPSRHIYTKATSGGFGFHNQKIFRDELLTKRVHRDRNVVSVFRAQYPACRTRHLICYAVYRQLCQELGINDSKMLQPR